MRHLFKHPWNEARSFSELAKKGVSDLKLGVGIENSHDADVYSLLQAAQWQRISATK